jgi:chemotaxis response regulator CheB
MALAAEALRRVVVSDLRHQVAWIAKDGIEAVRLCAQDTPDVVLMDLLMPDMNGAEATREIMQRSPCAVLVVTATVAGNFSLVCEAMGHGAYDAVATPIMEAGSAAPGAELLARLARVDEINKRIRSGVWAGSPSASRAPAPVAAAAPSPPAFGPTGLAPIVAIGASTGGPAAIDAVLSTWPVDFPGAVLIVQHVGAEFAPPLAQWLRGRTRLDVRVANEGDTPQPGVALLASTADHMVLSANGSIHYGREPADCPYRPSVDALFHSLAGFHRRPGVAILLTGIGSDGAVGLRALRDNGWLTIAQDQATSVVYGMPQAAARLDAAVRVMPLGDIAQFVENHLHCKRA